MQSKPEARRPGGRPRKALDVAAVEAMARIGLTVKEIAHVLRTGEATIRRRCKDALQQGRANLAMGLHRAQWRAAKKGDTRALIWLGKQYLGQSNNPEAKAGGVKVEVIEQIVTAPQDAT